MQNMKFGTRLHLRWGMVCVLAILSGCGNVTQIEPSSNEVSMPKENHSEALENTTNLQWKTRTREMPSPGPITAVFFLNASQGWIAQKDRIARTDDGGETWNTNDIASPGSGRISQLLFFDSLNGLVVSESDSKYPDLKYRIFITRDAGRTWRETFSGSGSANDVAYSSDRIFIVGSERPEGSKYKQRPLIIISLDKGETWSRDDFTRGQETELETLSNDAAMGIAFTASGIVKVATGRGYVYSKKVGDTSWQPRMKFSPRDFMPGIVAFGITSGEKIWSLESSGPSEEGILTRLYVEGAASQGKSITLEKSWTFSDGIHLGGESFLICGSEFKSHTDPKSKMISHTRAAVILQTTDAGLTFSEVFRDEREEEIAALYRLEANRFWAVGKNQRILELRLEKS